MHRFHALALVLAFSTGLALMLADAFAPDINVSLDSTTIRPEEGHAFIAQIQLRYRKIFELETDSTSTPAASSLRLIEDGTTLGPAHAPHVRIRSNGNGAYSHWKSQLYFSASDNTDPRTNGRSYVAQAKTRLNGALQAVGLVLLLTAGIVITKDRLARWTVSIDSAGIEKPCVITGLAIASAAGSVAWVLYAWHSGLSTSMAVVNYYPVSDAAGYYSCATSLAATGRFEYGAWCSRRALYPSMLATLLGISGWHGEIVLIFQAVLLGLTILAFSIEITRLLGWTAGTFAYVALFVFAVEFAFSQFMTEVAGMGVGLTGMALLLRYVRDPQRPWLIAGIALVSVALTARAGAILVIPALVVWGALVGRTSAAGSWSMRLLPIILAAFAGPLLQAGVLVALGIDARNSGGNFAASLYGLSTGSRDWSQAYRDFGDLFKLSESEAFRHIYGVAFGNILSSPGVFLNALLEAWQFFIRGLFNFGPLGAANAVLSLLLLAGLLASAHRWRSPLGSLLLLMAGAEAASAPLIIDSGGNRVFAASIAVRVILAVLGFHIALSAFVKLVNGRLPLYETAKSASSRPTLSLVLASVIPLAMIVPITPLGNLFRLKHHSGIGCLTQSAQEVVARLNRESQTMAIASERSGSSLSPYGVSRQRLASDGQLKNGWWGPDFLALPAGTLIIRAFQLGGTGFGTMQHLIWFGPFPTPRQSIVSLCVDPVRSTTLGDVAYRHVISITPVGR